MSNRKQFRVAMAGSALLLTCMAAAVETTGTQEATTTSTIETPITPAVETPTTATAETPATATAAAAEAPTTAPKRHVILIPEGMEQRWTRMEAAGRAAGLTGDELARLLDLESKVFMARAAGNTDAERQAVSQRRALLTPARWRALRDELRRQAVPDNLPGGAAAETTATATDASANVTTTL